MSNQTKVQDSCLGRCKMLFANFLFQITSASTLNSVIFRDSAQAPILHKFTSLFPGLGYAAGYKVSKKRISGPLAGKTRAPSPAKKIFY